MHDYDPKKIESFWQKEWEKSGIYNADDGSSNPKSYILIEFPFLSGDGLHTGHVRSYTALDAVARKRRMEGFNVLYPIGWDAFGLPTENYAIKTGRDPRDITKENADNFRKQLKNLGLSFDWSREFGTADPEYYKWTQWIFLKFLEKGLAYKAKMPINWCPSCKIGLANEEVVTRSTSSGQVAVCERCGTPVEQKEKEQWMLAITKYADRLYDDLDKIDYPERVKVQQRNWIGRSQGMLFSSPVKDSDIVIETFSAHFEAFCADTFVVIAPDHPLLPKLLSGMPEGEIILVQAREMVKKRMQQARNEEPEIEGIFTGRYTIDPVGNGELPIWVANFALADYGTGIVKCSAHDERDFRFAKKYDIKLKPVLFPEDDELRKKVEDLEICYTDMKNGILVEPKEFNNKRGGEVREEIIDYLEKHNLAKRKTTYKLRDWVFSRQRYWGEPIPVIHCEKCGMVPVPEEDLPVELPVVENYQPTETGESPLANIPEFVNTECLRCGGPAKRETDVMPNWAGSSWYFLAYLFNKKGFDDSVSIENWKLQIENFRHFMPVDWYNGGMEHTVLHLLYSRFWNKFLYDLKLVPTSEPYKKRTSHGLILAEGGEKMSKSKGNVINPDSIVERFGADTLRLYEMFMGPFEQAIAWSESALVGPRRFLEKVWRLAGKGQTLSIDPPAGEAGSQGLTLKSEALMHQTIKKVSDDVEHMRFNTAVSSLMIFVNELDRREEISQKEYETLLLLLAPFAPHITEEIWHKLGHKSSIHKEQWPEYDEKKLVQKEVTMVVQVNAKVRGKFMAPPGLTESEAVKTAKTLPEVKKWIKDQEIKSVIYKPGKVVSIVV